MRAQFMQNFMYRPKFTQLNYEQKTSRLLTGVFGFEQFKNTSN